MTRIDPQMKVRLSPILKARLTEEALENGRSINAEIVQRLEASLTPRSAASDLDRDVLRLLKEIHAILDDEALGLLKKIYDAVETKAAKEEPAEAQTVSSEILIDDLLDEAPERASTKSLLSERLRRGIDEKAPEPFEAEKIVNTEEQVRSTVSRLSDKMARLRAARNGKHSQPAPVEEAPKPVHGKLPPRKTTAAAAPRRPTPKLKATRSSTKQKRR